MNDNYYEKSLDINTCGEQKNFYESLHYNRYEPTSYAALNKLCEEYKFSSSDSVVDFGCGKGRLNFFLYDLYKCNVTGIEMNSYYYKQCLQNTKSYSKKHKIHNDNIIFSNCFAQDYEIKPSDNKFYFFNPFSVEIFIKVLENILDSKYKNNKTIDLILYYPSDDYIYYLENNTALTCIKEIKLDDLYDKDYRQKFSIYRL